MDTKLSGGSYLLIPVFRRPRHNYYRFETSLSYNTWLFQKPNTNPLTPKKREKKKRGREGDQKREGTQENFIRGLVDDNTHSIKQ